MAVQRTSFGKLQRDRAKKAKAAAKRERRQERAAGTQTPEEVVIAPEGELSAAELLTLIEAIHQRFEAGEMTFEEFEEKKAELMARLSVD